MTVHTDRPDLVYVDFVRELSRSPGRSDLLERLLRGHTPDEQGWCRHLTHGHQWEQHPCPVVRMVELVDDAAPHGRPGYDGRREPA